MRYFSFSDRSAIKLPSNLILFTFPYDSLTGDTTFKHFIPFLEGVWHLQELFSRVVRLLGFLQYDLVSFSVALVIVDYRKLVPLTESFVQFRI